MSEENKKGIKETSEMIDGLGVLAKAGHKISEDKKFDTSDLVHLVDVAKEFDTLMEGFKGADEIDDEIKDLDEGEAVALIAQLYKVIKQAKE